MDVASIISISREHTNTSVWQISDVKYLEYLNIVYKDVFSRLTTKSKKYTRQTYTTALVDWQSEYVIPKPTVSSTGIKLILDCYVDYGSWDVKARIYDSDIQEITDVNNPYIIQRDGSVFLYPIPWTWTLTVNWKYIPIDLELLDTESNIKLAIEYHDVLIDWLNMRVFWHKQLFDKQAIMKGNYAEWVKRIKEEWAMDVESYYVDSMENIPFELLE